MKRKPLLILLWSVVTVLVLASAMLLIGYAKWKKAEASPEKSRVLREAVPPEKVPFLAEKVVFSYEIESPWGRSMAGITVQPGKGSQLVCEPAVVRTQYRWGIVRRTLRAEVQAYQPGAIPEGTMEVSLSGGPDGKQILKLSLPAFRAALSPAKDLALADAVRPEKPGRTRAFWWGLGGGIALLILLLVVLIRMRRKRPEIPPELTAGERALEEIRRLRDSLYTGSLEPEQAVTGLNGIVRNYLEVRFRLRAEHQTTREFLSSIESSGPLNASQTGFLREFLASSDLVKFARLSASAGLFDRAADKAEELVRSSGTDTEKEAEK